MLGVHQLKQLYEIDDSQWLGETVSLLRNHQFSQLDLEHLIEELEDLGKEKKNAVASFLEQVIRHLLLLQYWTKEAEYIAFPNLMRYTKILTPDSSKPKTLYLPTMGIAIIQLIGKKKFITSVLN
jgi:hypothetical protein